MSAHHSHDKPDAKALRLTPLRRRVLDIVAKAPAPITAYEILDALRPQDASATAAGVYRSLEFLSQHTLVHRLESAKAFVACAMPDHKHMSQFMVCRKCGRAVEADDHDLNAAAVALAQKLGFKADQATLEISALCRDCV